VQLILFLVSGYAYAQKDFSLPVSLMIENGDLTQSIVYVKKNNVAIYSVPGKPFLKLKLAFNSDYIISFAKPGYITKSISVLTEVPPERSRHSFEPYKIGVKLFKQYEGVNIVVYNQPVARIKFNHFIDDFDYDVDYTKSILSILKVAEDELAIKAEEERKLSGGTSHGPEEIKYIDDKKYLGHEGSLTEHHNENIVPVQNDNTIVIQDAEINKSGSKKVYQLNGEMIEGTSVNSSNQSTKQKAVQNSEEQTEFSAEDHGQDAAANINGSENSEMKSSLSKSADDEHTTSKRNSSGSESKSDFIKSNGSQDFYAAPEKYKSTISKSVSVSTEKSRTVTTITIIDGPDISVYTKVDYNWGAVYYFRNGETNISRDVFISETGN
jgi:hypothetical protein